MKKNVFKLIGIAAIVFTLQSCNDEFLEEGPSAFITADQLADAVAVNPDIAAGTVDGLYVTMFTSGTGGTGGHDDFGQKAYDVFTDMLCSDMALSNSSFGWYRSSITEYQATQDFTFTDNRQAWFYYYQLIFNANLALDNFGGQDGDPENVENRYALGQVLASRAHSYFMLTQLFANDYDPSAAILPLYTFANPLGQGKSLTSEIYESMENSLNRAIELLEGYNRPSKAQINQSVAKGILAHVIASTRSRWDEVAQLSDDVLTESGTVLMPSDNSTFGALGGFNNVGNPSWLWGVDLNGDTGVGLVSWWGQVDFFSYSYAAVGDTKTMDVDLYESMRADDVRRQQFFNTPGLNYLQPLNKQFDESRVEFGTNTTTFSDYHYMRYAEFILLKAEAMANMGQDGPARMALMELVSERIGDPSYLNALSGQALKDEIYKQTRLELWGEGRSYFAMKRNMATTQRGSNHLSFVGEPIAHNDERMTFEIPQLEIQNNGEINDQN
ncbi:RagB/SusD family nutrient uptake outer membrane protein [Winogradskyella sp. UBA3174]|uniref:RagB/SusD family nutrient uptake outer membrane protein n=1 Tax=Winogradskyella sp. UBA3174 TaxID=1947785 RepID=UPI0025CC1CC6|nr:RagB/SusD family nutrient uptake outer membrane protein [Winogradskyella sp. UBA3174]|tara:strand:+ start:30676 stop:32172 length:1497 start_codon:yes stop_codon:yes gene_type:complete